MTTKEVSVPYMVDDFEQDDIVWHSNLTDNTFLFGRVSTNDADTIYASCEDGIMHIVPIESFGKRSRNGEIWGKLLDISQLKTGSRLSSKGGNERVFWEVTEFRDCRPDASGRMKMVSGTGSSAKHWDKSFGNMHTLKMLMVGLVLEG